MGIGEAMLTVLATLELTANQREAIQSSGADTLTEKAAPDLSDVADIEVWLGGGLTAEVLAAAHRLRWVQVSGAGVESILFPEFVASNVVVTNVRGMHSDTVADHAIALILAHARNLAAYVRQQDRREWLAAPAHELAGMTMTVVGMGTIGGAIADLAEAFGMKVTGVRRTAPAPETGVSSSRRVVGSTDLREAIAGADWVVVAAPLTPGTRNLIGAREFAAMKHSAVVVNVGRGPVIDEKELERALATHAIAGACLDVFVDEPLSVDSPLWAMPSVIITPHVAGIRSGFQDRVVELFCDNLRRYVSGMELRNQIDKLRGY